MLLLAATACHLDPCGGGEGAELLVLRPRAELAEGSEARPGHAIVPEAMATDSDLEGRVVVVTREAEGAITYLARYGHGWVIEPVAEAGIGGVALDHLPDYGEALVAAIVERVESDSEPAVGPVDAPDVLEPGEGVLLLARRRAPKLWRRRPIAARALNPALRAGPKETVHLVFLQRTTDGYAVRYVETDGIVTRVEEIGRTTVRHTPRLALRDGLPIVLWQGSDGRLRLARANERLAFDSEVLPADRFGASPASPEGFDFAVGTDGRILVAWLRSVDGATVSVGQRTLEVPPEVQHGGRLLLVGGWSRAPRVRWVAALPGGGEFVSLDLEAAPLRLVVAAGGAGAAAEWTGDGFAVHSEVPGRVLLGGVAGRAAVFATEARLWVVPLSGEQEAAGGGAVPPDGSAAETKRADGSATTGAAGSAADAAGAKPGGAAAAPRPSPVRSKPAGTPVGTATPGEAAAPAPGSAPSPAAAARAAPDRSTARDVPAPPP
ncbi:MAG: hypothetical protein D6729_08145 [Deltaproteobacteria bacterium]|nr:MAG: hypothetical protein D6729_08145 [Deltaproteobacteria bacterium]